MSFTFQSAAQYIEEPLDCRRLTLSLNYSQLNKAQVIHLVEILTQWVTGFTDGQFIMDYSINGSSTKEKVLLSQMADALKKSDSVMMGYEAYNISCVVHNTTSMRKFQRNLKKIHPVYSFGWDVDPLAWGVSLDYPSFFDAKFPMERPEKEQIIPLICQVFREEGKMYRTLHRWSDLSGGFRAQAHTKNPERFFGAANISFSAFCLGTSVQETAEHFSRLAEEMASEFVHLNVHIALQPAGSDIYDWKSPYMKYFGKALKMDSLQKAMGIPCVEWYPTYFLCGVEWYNLLSPLTAGHISGCNGGCIRKTPQGGLIVQSSKKITDYDIPDAHELKRILGQSLYPGTSHITIRGIFPWKNTPRIYEWCPRNDWAIVPIEEKEIRIVGTDLIYASINMPDSHV